MDINKQDMTEAFINRANADDFNKFIGYLNTLSIFIVNKLKINPIHKDDIKQIALEHAFVKMDKYDPTTGSAAYSYFYKVIYMRCIYELRAIKKKQDRRPPVCSLDFIENSDSVDHIQYLSDSEEYINIEGISYNKVEAFNKAKYAKSLVRQKKLVLEENGLIFSGKTGEEFVVDDNLVKVTCVQILKNKKDKELKKNMQPVCAIA